MKNVHLCSFMLHYGWYFDNSNHFSGVNIWKMSIYVQLRCSRGDILIMHMILGWTLKHVHLCPFMMQYGWYFDISKKVNKKASFRIEKIFYVHSWDSLCTLFSSILEDATECIFFQFHILCTGGMLCVYIYIMGI